MMDEMTLEEEKKVKEELELRAYKETLVIHEHSLFGIVFQCKIPLLRLTLI
jgi:hypothetical protein